MSIDYEQYAAEIYMRLEGDVDIAVISEVVHKAVGVAKAEERGRCALILQGHIDAWQEKRNGYKYNSPDWMDCYFAQSLLQELKAEISNSDGRTNV